MDNDITRSKILLVEDSVGDQVLTMRAIGSTGLDPDVVLARSGDEALDYLFGRGSYEGRDALDVPDLILLDIKLPRVGGLEVLETLRKDPRMHHIPVVVLTSSSEASDTLRSYELGVNSFVQKPVEWSDFIQVLRHVCEYWLLVNETIRPHKA